MQQIQYKKMKKKLSRIMKTYHLISMAERILKDKQIFIKYKIKKLSKKK